MFRAPPMLLPHESTVGAGHPTGLVTSESTRAIGFGEPPPEMIDNPPTLSPDDERGSTLSLEISKAEKKADDLRKISTTESKKQRVSNSYNIIRLSVNCFNKYSLRN